MDKNLCIMIEPTSYCNLNCFFCTSSYGKARLGFLEINNLKKIIADGKNYISDVMLWWRGEPLLHEKIVDMVKMLSDANIRTCMSTNGLMLTKNMTNELISANLNSLLISFAGITKEVYESHMIGGNFETFMKNMRDAVEIDNANTKQIILLRPLITKQNIHQIDDFEKLIVELNVTGMIRFAIVDSGNSIDYAVEDTELNDFVKCPIPKWGSMEMPTISWDGCVGLCFDSEHTFGNCFTENIIDIYKKEDFIKYRDYNETWDAIKHINSCIKIIQRKNVI